MSGLVSVIVPVYNVEQYIEKCLDSICGQDYANLQIILVDDGSADASGAICDRYARKDGRIQVIHQKNGGLSAARNAGMDRAEGDYLVFVDSDDWIERDMVSYMLHRIEKEEAQMAICGMYLVTGRRRKIRSVSKDEVLSRGEALRELSRNGKIQNYVCSQMTERKLMEGIRFPDGRNFEDILTTYRVMERAERVLLLKEPKYNYLQRKGGITNGKKQITNLARCDAHRVRYEDIVERHPELAEELLRQFFFSYRKLVRDGLGKGEDFERLKEFYRKAEPKLCGQVLHDPLERQEAAIMKQYEGGISPKLLWKEFARICKRRQGRYQK